MPNWCSNNLEINGDEQELDKLECLMATGEQEFDFNVISKSPEGDDWFTWRMETWGTKLNAKGRHLPARLQQPCRQGLIQPGVLQFL